MNLAVDLEPLQEMKKILPVGSVIHDPIPPSNKAKKILSSEVLLQEAPGCFLAATCQLLGDTMCLEGKKSFKKK